MMSSNVMKNVCDCISNIYHIFIINLRLKVSHKIFVAESTKYVLYGKHCMAFSSTLSNYYIELHAGKMNENVLFTTFYSFFHSLSPHSPSTPLIFLQVFHSYNFFLCLITRLTLCGFLSIKFKWKKKLQLNF